MKILGLALMLTLAAGTSQAQRVHTPAAGTPERRLLMDALRLRMQRELNRPMIFEVRQLRVLGSWAFAEVVPKKPDGSRFDYRGTPLEQEWRDGVVDEASVALLRRVDGAWRVVKLAIGPTDVAWWGWDEETGAPGRCCRIPSPCSNPAPGCAGRPCGAVPSRPCRARGSPPR